MKRNTGCQPLDHQLSRRGFLAGSVAGSALALGAGLSAPAAEQLQRHQKQILQVYLHGGLSQLESWDPKPGTKYGGPFRAIPTSVPGLHISELLPCTAQVMHLLSVVRSVNTRINDHAQGRLFLEKGRRAGNFPYVGAVASRYLASPGNELPGYVHISTRGSNENTGGFLEARHTQLTLFGSQIPANLTRPASLTADADERRQQLRQTLNTRFSQGRQKARIETYGSAYEQAARLMSRKALFEEPFSDKDVERYGRHDFATHCLMARRLLEAGVTCVKVTQHEYDSHAENFNFHLEQLAEFDQTFATLLTDLHDRGMLEQTLVMIYSEFGRTPKVNVRYGRDHWGTAWSVVLGGCGIQPGAVIGKTNDEGTAVIDREVDGGHLFHTYFQALGLDSRQDHDISGRSLPIGDPSVEAIKELLA